MNPVSKNHQKGPQILLVNPWIYDFAAYDLWAKPLGLLYIAAHLRAKGYQVRLLDCLDQHRDAGTARSREKTYGCGKFAKEIVPKPAIYDSIPRRYGRYGISETSFVDTLSQLDPPAAILVTSGMTYWYPGVFRAIQLLRSRFPKKPILLGGIYATLCTEHARRHAGADQVITGQGEAAALAAVDHICDHRSGGPACDDLNALPFPAFDLYSKRDYACLLTSRGCPYRCSYCASWMLSDGYRRRAVEDVLAELKWLRCNIKIKNIAFYDDALLIDSDEHIKPILEGAVRMDLDAWLHTPNGLHARLIDAELARLMFRSGFKTVRLSLETTDSIRQHRMGPKASREDLVQALEHLQKAGYRREEIGVYLLAGLPDQPYEEIVKGVDFVAGLGARTYLALYSPIPGTDEWQRAVRQGQQDPRADPLLHNNTVFSSSLAMLSREQLNTLKQYVQRRNRSLS